MANPISNEATVQLGAEFIAAGLLTVKDGKPHPTLKGILFVQIMFQGWTLFDLFSIAAKELGADVEQQQTEDAVQRIVREYAQGVASGVLKDDDSGPATA